MFAQALSADTLRGLKVLGQEGVLGEAYLAGGTALALHINHRESVDLDFFTKEEFDERELMVLLSKLEGFEKERASWRTIFGRLYGVKFTYFYFPYPLIEKTVSFEGVSVLGLKDLAAMKLHAIEDRGTKRDFIDLFFLSQSLDLGRIFSYYDQKFGCLDDHRYHILRSLQYFEDADMDEIPKMFKQVEWEKVKEYFRNQVKQITESALGGKVG